MARAVGLRRTACLIVLIELVVGWFSRPGITSVPQAQAGTVRPRPERYRGWSSNGPLGGEVRVLAVDPSSSLNVYAGTEQGVMKSTDAGTTWRAANNGIGKTMVSGLVIDRTNPTTLHAATWGGVFKSTDAGASWRLCGLPGLTVLSIAADPYNSRVLYAAGWGRNVPGEGVFRTTDGGNTWTSTMAGLPPGADGIVAVAPTNPSTVYLGADGYGVFKRAGKVWARTAFASMKFSNGTSVLSLVADPLGGRTSPAAMPLIGPAGAPNEYCAKIVGTSVRFS